MNDLKTGKFEILWLIIKGLYWAGFGGGLLLLLCIPWLLLNDQAYALHNFFISLERPTYNALMFLILSELKLFLLVFLVLPAIGLHIALCRHLKAIQKTDKVRS